MDLTEYLDKNSLPTKPDPTAFDFAQERRNKVFGAPTAQAAGAGLGQVVGDVANTAIEGVKNIAPPVAQAAGIAAGLPTVNDFKTAGNAIVGGVQKTGDFLTGLVTGRAQPSVVPPVTEADRAAVVPAAPAVPPKQPAGYTSIAGELPPGQRPNPQDFALPPSEGIGMAAPAGDQVMVRRTAPTVAAPRLTPTPQIGFGAKGGLFGSMIDLTNQYGAAAVIKNKNNIAQQNFKNQVGANEANAAAQKSASGEDVTDQTLAKGATEIAKGKIDLDSAKQKQDVDNEVRKLQSDLITEKDPKKRAILMQKLYARIGKPQPKYQIVTSEEASPDGIGTIKKPYIVQEDENGSPMARPLVQTPTMASDPKAIAIRDNKSLSVDDKRKQLQALGYK